MEFVYKLQGDEDRPTYKQNNNTNCNIFFFLYNSVFYGFILYKRHAFKLVVVSKKSLIKLNLLAAFGWTVHMTVH